LESVREPVVAGQFYPENAQDLHKQIKECFLDYRGFRSIPEIKQGGKKPIGMVVPHAGFVYSGAIASHSYSFLAENGFADSFIILGPNHSGRGSGVSVMTEGAWKTPLGEVSINTEIAKQLHTGIIDKDEAAHSYEHSIEVQLPFLQFISGDKSFDIVPICVMMQDYETSKEIGNIIADVIKKSKKSIVVIASSDFSHAGFNYMSMPPPGVKVEDYAEKQDKKAISKILEMDPEGLINIVQQENITMCGYGPVSAMIVASKSLGAKKVDLLKYGTSCDVYPSSSCVGYGALVLY
jgi:AmmeMemoRadiSam system protein B